ncbi:MAG: VCBS repeat-containing protein, partial [Saprospiraceae bacterium]
MTGKTFQSIFFAFVLICVVACKSDNHRDQQDAPAPAPSVKNADGVAPETHAMIDSVQKAHRSVDPMKTQIIMTAQRAMLYRQQANAVQGLDKVNFLLMAGFEDLKAGNTAAAMSTFREVLAFVEPIEGLDGKEQTVIEVKKLLALGALRLGEQENCILNHTAQSCIVPIAKAGQHTKPEGSAEAMALYQEILRVNPDDLTSKYLLNIAAMTLGKFPDGVPASMRLPKGLFESKVSFPTFTDIAGPMGLDRRGQAGGIAVEDFDRDGHLDIMHSAWGFNDQIMYFHNNGDGTFTDIAMTSGLKGITGGLNLRHGDYNNDGYADFLILRGAWLRDQGKIPSSLIRNNGDGTFTDVTVGAGIYAKRPTQNAVWADFDLDGWLDLFIGYESMPEQGPLFTYPSVLYHNQRNGTFKEVSAAAGLNVNTFIKGSTVGDINNDGLEDLFLSVFNGPKQLYLNVSTGDQIRFQNISAAAGVADNYVSFPTWMFDYNNDGFLDIFISAYSDGSDPRNTEDLPGKILKAYGKTDDPGRPHVYKNNGNNTFTDVSSSLGLVEPGFTMGSNYGDLDNDGFLDFYLATGEPNLKSIVPNKMYWNRGGKAFADVTYAGGFGNIQKGHAVGFGDLDRDGDQDIYVIMGGSFEGDVYQNMFFENQI